MPNSSISDKNRYPVCANVSRTKRARALPVASPHITANPDVSAGKLTVDPNGAHVAPSMETSAVIRRGRKMPESVHD